VCLTSPLPKHSGQLPLSICFLIPHNFQTPATNHAIPLSS
jgi:hypothetical protein